MNTKRTTRSTAVIAAVLALVVAACGGDDDSADSQPEATTAPADTGEPADGEASDDGSQSATEDEPAATTVPDTDASVSEEPDTTPTTEAVAVPCDGDPIRLTMVGTLSGPLAYPSVVEGAEQGREAAIESVNRTCELGRPLVIEVCDDMSDSNEATRCGREAKDNGSLAIFGSLGVGDGGPTASGLPAILGPGSTLFDLTNEAAYPGSTAVALVLGTVSAAAGTGAEKYLTVALDSASTRAFMGASEGVAAQLGVDMEVLWFPADTTDFAPVAAQIAQRDADAIGLVVSNMVPFMNALASEGISPNDTPIFTAVDLLPPEVIDEVGDKVDGMYLISQYVAPIDTDNPNIALMHQDLAAMGITVEANQAPSTVRAWSNVWTLVDILQTLSEEELAALDTEMLVGAFNSVGAIERPEVATIDYSAPAFADIEALASLRMFNRDALIVQVVDGGYQTVSEFSDVTGPFDLGSGE